MPISKPILAVTLSLAAVAAAGATLAFAGPLSPPEGPVQSTSPSLADVLAAVESQSATPDPCAEASVPGAPVQAIVRIPELGNGDPGGNFDAYEVLVGADRTADPGQAIGPMQLIGVRIVRDIDQLTPQLFLQMAQSLTIPSMEVEFFPAGGSPSGLREVLLEDVTILGVEHRLVETCAGGRMRETLTLSPERVTYQVQGVVGGYDFRTGATIN